MDTEMDLETKRGYHLDEDYPNDEHEVDHIPADVLAGASVAHTPFVAPYTPASSPPPDVHAAILSLSEPSSLALQDAHIPRPPPTATRSTGHISPGHLVGRPIHDSPRANRLEIIPNDIFESQPALPAPFHPGLESQQSSVHIDPVARAPGSEPGVDVRRESARRAYAHLKEDCEIEVVDYDDQHVKFRQFHNESFIKFLETTDRKPPMKVRWINVAGISWDIISALALKYQLHPLAVEDVLHSRSVSLSKADYFQRHLFLRVICHALSSKRASPLNPKYFKDDNEEDSSTEEEDTDTEEEPTEEVEDNTRMPMLRRATRRRRRKASKASDTEAATGNRESVLHPLRWMEANMLLSPEGRRRQARIAKLNALKKQGRVRVMVSNAFFFLFKDGTLISFHQGDRSFGDPVYQRLRHVDTVLRKDPEASLLMQGLLDLIVDQAVQVVDKYGDKINERETQVLLKPNMNLVQSLHILSADLTLRKRTLQPLKALVYGLRRFDVQRTAAACGLSGPVEGYMSAKTKIYLSDVSDHIEAILNSLDQFATMTDNLIDFTFNMTAHETNEQMKRMTILMCIFLPLTLLSGYFGMNFEIMPIVKEHSDIIFWEIALPVMAIIIPWSLWGDIRKLFLYMVKNQVLDRVEKRQNRKVQSAKKADRIRRRTLEKERVEKKEKEQEKGGKDGDGIEKSGNGLGLEHTDVKVQDFSEKTAKSS